MTTPLPLSFGEGAGGGWGQLPLAIHGEGVPAKRAGERSGARAVRLSTNIANELVRFWFIIADMDGIQKHLTCFFSLLFVMVIDVEERGSNVYFIADFMQNLEADAMIDGGTGDLASTA